MCMESRSVATRSNRGRAKKVAFVKTFFLSNVILGLALGASAVAAQDLDSEVVAALRSAGFTGRVGSGIEGRLGRRIDTKLANLGRLLFFDKIASLHSD